MKNSDITDRAMIPNDSSGCGITGDRTTKPRSLMSIARSSPLFLVKSHCLRVTGLVSPLRMISHKQPCESPSTRRPVIVFSGRRAPSIVAPFSTRRNPVGCVTACDAATCAQSRSKQRRWRQWWHCGAAAGRTCCVFILCLRKNDHTNFSLGSIESGLEGLEELLVRMGPGHRAPNRLCAVSFIMPWATGTRGLGPRVEDSSAKWTGWYFTS